MRLFGGTQACPVGRGLHITALRHQETGVTSLPVTRCLVEDAGVDKRVAVLHVCMEMRKLLLR
jgi:hypothetical protein